MIAKAIGPQNTVGAIGIMPSTVETAVSMIGRKRVLLASSAASPDALARRSLGLDLADQDHRVLGDHAEQRQDAEDGDEARAACRTAAAPPTTPISPSGATLSTMNRRWKLCSWNISTVSMISSITGTTATTEACDLALSSTVPPTSRCRSPAAGVLASSSIAGVERGDDGLRQRARRDVGLHGQGRHPVAPPDQREVLVVLERRELAERHRPPVRQRDLQGRAGCRARRAARRSRAPRRRRDRCRRGPGSPALPEITVLSTLASACELRPSRRASSWSIRMRTSRAGSIQSKLICSRVGFGRDDLRQLRARSRAPRAMSGPLTRYCTGQPTGGPSSSGETRATTLGNSSASSFSSFACSRSRAATSLATITAWAKKSLGSCTFERQVEADRAAPDIGAPALDVRDRP